MRACVENIGLSVNMIDSNHERANTLNYLRSVVTFSRTETNIFILPLANCIPASLNR